MSKSWKITFFFLSLSVFSIWLSVFSISSKSLKIISCNVGQGDSTIITYRSFQILIDGGPDNKVLGCLSKYLPFWDRKIEVVVLTHPQADHYMGLLAVFKRYKVGKILANSLNASTQTYDLLKKEVLDGGVEVINPTSGMSVRSGLIQLDILHPSREFIAINTFPNNSNPTNSSNPPLSILGISDSDLDPNEFSIVTLLKFSSFRYLFPGDVSGDILDFLASELSQKGEKPVNYIKIPHHGSKNSISEKLYGLIDGLAVISVGKNSYGHPNEEVIKRLSDKGIKVMRTDGVGDIVVETDGKRIWVEKGNKYQVSSIK